MTLKEQFDKVIQYPFSEYKEQLKVLREENSSRYEKIADDFAIGFAKWMYDYKGDINKVEELLKIYKKEL